MDPLDPRWCARLRAGTPTPPEPARREAYRTDFDPAYDPAAPVVCEVCGHAMHYTGACKLMCGNCGYKRDCSDP